MRRAPLNLPLNQLPRPLASCSEIEAGLVPSLLPSSVLVSELQRGNQSLSPRQCPVSEFRGRAVWYRDRRPHLPGQLIPSQSRIWSRCSDSCSSRQPWPGRGPEGPAGLTRRLPVPCWPRRAGPHPGTRPCSPRSFGGYRPQRKTRPQKRPRKDLAQSPAKARVRANHYGTGDAQGPHLGAREGQGWAAATQAGLR